MASYMGPTVADIPRTLPETRGPALLLGRHQSPLARGRTILRTGANLLSPNQASLETDATGWLAYYRCTIARSTAQAADGSASLALTHTTGGTAMIAVTPITTDGVPVTPGTRYTALASFRAAATPRNTAISIYFWNAAGGALSSTESTQTADSTSAWTDASVSAVAPATAAFSGLLATVYGALADGEVHYLDKAALLPAGHTAWDLPVYTITDNPSQADLDAASAFWLGGHVYTDLSTTVATEIGFVTG